MKKIIGSIIILFFVIIHPVSAFSFEDSLDKPTITNRTYIKYIIFNDEIRSYIIHIPINYDDSVAVPLVLNFHANRCCSFTQMFISKFNDKSDEEGFIVVYPNGHFDMQYFWWSMKKTGIFCLIMGYRYFNAWDYINANVDDIAYVKKIISDIKNEYNINNSRIYATGLSGGGLMSYRLGAELSDVFAAIAPVGASIGGRYWIDDSIDTHFPIYVIPDPENPMPVIVFHGMKDKILPYEGIEDKGFGKCFISVNESVDFWVENNNCDPTPEIIIGDSGNIIKRTYSNCDNNCDVILYSIVNTGHEWFGGPRPIFSPCEICATDLIWAFFEAHSKQ